MSETAVIQAILHNSLYVDQPHVWQQNVANLKKLLVGETAVSLRLGTEPKQLISVIEKII